MKFGSIDQFSPDVVSIYEAALLSAQGAGKSIKAILICNPHNPLGHVYSQETLRGLLGLAAKHNIHLISDEIYALSTFSVAGREAEKFTSVLSLQTDRSDLVHVLYGMSKVQRHSLHLFLIYLADFKGLRMRRNAPRLSHLSQPPSSRRPPPNNPLWRPLGIQHVPCYTAAVRHVLRGIFS